MSVVLWLAFFRITVEDDFDITLEQCAVIRFFVWKGKSPTEMTDKLCNVYIEDELLLPSTIYRWHKVYQAERQSFILQKSSG